MKASFFVFSALLEVVTVTASPRNVIRRGTDRSKSICGKTGYDKGTESFWGSTDGSYSACSNACIQQKCKSFAYGAGECQLYDVSVRSNFVAVNDSPYMFYDSSCISSVTSTTSIVVITSTSKTTTISPKGLTSTSSTTTPKVTSSTTSTKTSAKSTTTTTSSVVKSSSQTTPKMTTTMTTKKITTTTAASTTSATSSISNDVVCGQQGYFVGSSGFHGYQIGDGQPTQENLTECYQYCVNSDEGYCAGWYWSPDSYDNCVLMSYAPEGGHFSPSDSSGIYVWDRVCGTPCASGAGL